MTNDRLRHLHDAGVSIWLDTLSRDLLDSGRFAELIGASAVTGATSNPTIFAKALADSELYDEQLAELAATGVSDLQALFFGVALDDIRHAAELQEKGIHHVDCGTSGGVWGFERGFCLMIGGPDEAVQRLDPIFATIAPGVDSAERTPGRDGEPTPAENGYLHCGPTGAGHFVKMVHNGIEYGMMQSLAEGW